MLFVLGGLAGWAALNPAIPFPLALFLVAFFFYWIYLIVQILENAWQQMWGGLFRRK